MIDCLVKTNLAQQLTIKRWVKYNQRYISEKEIEQQEIKKP